VGAPLPDGDAISAQLLAARQDAQLMSEQMRSAWLDFLQAETSAHPVLLVLEDLHWSDFGTVRFVDAALRERSKQPWMMIALARPDVFDVFPKLWADRPNVQELRLKELGRKAGERLVRQVLGDVVGSDTVERLVHQADGNVFYLEELIRAVAEGKDRHAPLPGTVLAMVETRLGRLPFEARRVLRAASVFGEVCWEGGVVVLLGGAMEATAVGEWLARLVAQEVLTVRPDGRFPGERELVFRHALLREGASATLTAEDERLAHRLAGEWLEQHGEADPMVLVGHYRRGGDNAHAVRCYLRAAEQACHILDYKTALTRADLGLACDPPPEIRMALLGIRCYAAQTSQGVTLVEVEELLRTAPPGSIPWTQGMFAFHLGAMVAGRTEEFLASLAQLREVTPAPGAAGGMALVFLGAVFILDSIGRLTEATTLEEPFLALARARGDHEPFARLWWNYAVGLRAAYAHDDPWTGLSHCEAMRVIVDAIGGEATMRHMQLLRGMNQWYLGVYGLAAQALEAIPTADTAMGMASSQRRFFLSWLYADRGELDRAHALATQLCASRSAIHDRMGESRGRWVLAEVLHRMGEFDAAERELALALAMAIPHERPGALGTLSRLRLAQGRPTEALAAAQDALARDAAMGGCGMFRGAFVRLAHAEALHATGAHEAAAGAIARARDRLHTIAGKIADPDYRASFLSYVPENAQTLALAHAWLDL
jgi:tetratricopeptide (TPR) repeat protein